MPIRNGKARHALRLLGVAALALAMLSSCQVISLLFGITIDQRVKDFSNSYMNAAANGDYGNMYTNFSTSTQQYDNIKASSFWYTSPFQPGYHPQALTNYNVSGSTVTGYFTNDNGTVGFTMQMQLQGIDWYILSLTVDAPSGSTSGPFTVKLVN